VPYNVMLSNHEAFWSPDHYKGCFTTLLKSSISMPSFFCLLLLLVPFSISFPIPLCPFLLCFSINGVISGPLAPRILLLTPYKASFSVYYIWPLPTWLTLLGKWKFLLMLVTLLWCHISGDSSLGSKHFFHVCPVSRKV